MRTKLSSSNLADMSVEDMKHITMNTEHERTSFKGMIKELTNIRNSIQKMQIDKSTKKDHDNVEHFGYGWAGYDDLWNPYRQGRLLACISVLNRDIAN